MRLSKPCFLNIICGLLTLAIALATAPSQAFAASESVLWNFGNGSDGAEPYAALIRDANDNLYGTTVGGGIYGFGTVFKLSSPAITGGNWTESILWNFGNGSDGRQPYSALTMDASGNLYGTTRYGGLVNNPPLGDGTAFKLTPPGTPGGNWTESILWEFGSGNDGARPAAGVIIDASGNLYGTTQYGGNSGGSFYRGTVFELTPPSSAGGTWNESILWNFGAGLDGGDLLGGLIMDASGNLYGTTYQGGSGNYDSGTVFRLIPPLTHGGSWTESILWIFDSYRDDGRNPAAGLIMDASGNLYGTTQSGGNIDQGTVFELTPPSTGIGSWSESILWSFPTVQDDGANVVAGLIMGTSGNLYGTTLASGTQGGGIAFELTPPATLGANWNESILSDFAQNGGDGASGPKAGLIMDGKGNLYGTTSGEGTNGAGTVFEISNLEDSGQIFIKPQHILFPNTAIGSTSTFQLGLRNTGTGQLTGTVEAPSAPFGLSGSGSFNLAPKAETTVTLTFTPTAVRPSRASGTVVSSSVTNNHALIQLQGTGTP